MVVGGLAGCVVFAAGAVFAGGAGPGGPDLSCVSIRGGEFTMGSRDGAADEQPRSEAVGDFRLGRCEVTVEEYAEYLNSAPAVPAPPPVQIARRMGRYRPRWSAHGKPVACVSYDDAAAYCRWLSAKSGCRVRLPSEAEWEFAARGGISQAPFPWGWGDAKGRACFAEAGPRRVGSFDPNPFGLCDAAGNVFEWCALPAGQETNAMAVARGGSWAERDAAYLRVFQRSRFRRDYRDADVGFRILVEPPAETRDGKPGALP